MIDVTLEDAYAEACRALGESIVRERLLTAALAQGGQGHDEAQHAPRGSGERTSGVDPDEPRHQQ